MISVSSSKERRFTCTCKRRQAIRSLIRRGKGNIAIHDVHTPVVYRASRLSPVSRATSFENVGRTRKGSQKEHYAFSLRKHRGFRQSVLSFFLSSFLPFYLFLLFLFFPMVLLIETRRDLARDCKNTRSSLSVRARKSPRSGSCWFHTLSGM